MKSRGETETNHMRFWKSFRKDWFSKLIGGENCLIFLRSTVSDSLSLPFGLCEVKYKEAEAWVSPED